MPYFSADFSQNLCISSDVILLTDGQNVLHYPFGRGKHICAGKYCSKNIGLPSVPVMKLPWIQKYKCDKTTCLFPLGSSVSSYEFQVTDIIKEHKITPYRNRNTLRGSINRHRQFNIVSFDELSNSIQLSLILYSNLWLHAASSEPKKKPKTTL